MAQTSQDKAQPRVFFADVEPMLMAYKNASPVDRQLMLTEVVQKIENIKKIDSKEAAIQVVQELAYAKTLFKYAKDLQAMENMGWFECLGDFAAAQIDLTTPVKLDGVEEEIVLSEFIELQLNKPDGLMRFKKPLSELPFDHPFWKAFAKRQAEWAAKENKPWFKVTYPFDNEEAFKKQLYPVPMQGLGNLNNNASDALSTNNVTGKTAVAPRSGGFCLPAGGMKNGAGKAITTAVHEELEEKRGNFLEDDIKLGEQGVYNKIDKVNFRKILVDTITEKKKSIGKKENENEAKDNYQELFDFINGLSDLVKEKNEAGEDIPNTTNMKAVYDAINAQEQNYRDQIDAAGDNQALKAQLEDKITILGNLKAELRVNTLEGTQFYKDLEEQFAQGALTAGFQQFNDVRCLGGTQTSSVFFMAAPIDEWFKERGYGVQLADDLAGGQSNEYTFYQFVANAKFSHHLVSAASNIIMLENGAMDYSVLNNQGQYRDACGELVRMADGVMQANAVIIAKNSGMENALGKSLQKVVKDNVDPKSSGTIQLATSQLGSDISEVLSSTVDDAAGVHDKGRLEKIYDASLGKIDRLYENYAKKCFATLDDEEADKLLAGVGLVIATFAYAVFYTALAAGLGVAFGAIGTVAVGGTDFGFSSLVGGIAGAVVGFIVSLKNIATIYSDYEENKSLDIVDEIESLPDEQPPQEPEIEFDAEKMSGSNIAKVVTEHKAVYSSSASEGFDKSRFQIFDDSGVPDSGYQVGDYTKFN